MAMGELTELGRFPANGGQGGIDTPNGELPPILCYEVEDRVIRPDVFQDFHRVLVRMRVE